MGKKQSWRRKHFYLFLTCLITILVLLSGCAHFNGVNADFESAEGFTKQGNYKAALDKYEQIFSRNPQMGDKALFQKGIIYILPQIKHKDYNESQE
ncbi:MAG: peptidase, partial [Smithella sp.]